ncbi:MAG TPA: thiamine phosphate synthase, partial [Polyangiaceae bacterium]|nr:thiamine phosphate synthase [Polyangiaceae bacterium]
SGSDAVAFLEVLLGARPPLVQLRAKTLDARGTLDLLRAFRVRTRRAGVKLFANDRPDLAVLAECDGVHLGQSDLPAGEVRRCFPRLELGLSTHTLDQLDEALAARPDYVAFGPVFRTRSKHDAEPVVGLEGLRRAAERVGGQCPLVAIGGIDASNVADVARVADLAAVIGALVPAEAAADAVASAALELTSAFSGG